MWIEKLARLGYGTKGIVYGLIGVLAVLAALGSGGKTTDTKGTLHTIAAQPFGSFLIALVAVGMTGYALWRLVQAVADPDKKGSDAEGIGSRIGYAISGLMYGSLALTAAKLALGSGGGSGGKSKQDWTAQLLQQPFGPWLVGTVGAIIIGIGFYRLYQAYKIKFRKELDLSQISQEQENWLVTISRVGISARGIIFVMTGFFLIQAAKQFDPNQVRGLDGVLQTLAQQPYGKLLLGLVAVGLIAYGAYMWVQALYRQINVS